MAQELWEAWQDGVATAGGTLSAEEGREGNQLVLSDLRLDFGGEAGVLQLEQLTLINQADGSVGVILPDSFPLMLELPQDETAGAEGQPEQIFIRVDAPDLALTVRGLGEKAEFQASSPTVTLTLDRMVPPLPEADGKIDLSAVLGGFDLRYVQDLALESPMIDAAVGFDSISAVLTISDNPEANGVVTLKLGKSHAAASGAVPLSSPAMQALQARGAEGPQSLGDIAAVLDAGLRLDASIALSEAVFAGDVLPVGEKPVTWNAALQRVAASAGLNAEATGFSIALNGLNILAEGDIPEMKDGPVGISLDEYRVAAKIGLNGWRGPQDWSLAYVLRNVVASEALWAQDDPGRALPRDPVTLALDLGGRYGLRPEALAPGYQPGPGNIPFSELGVKINELKLAGLGAQMVGQGGLDLDFTDLTTFEGFPAPAGRVNFLTTGAYGLLETLSKAGLIEQSELTGIRGALLVLGRAGEAPDTLHTDIDFRDKSLFLNGVKIR